MRRRLFPMPVEALADSDLAMTLPAAAYGMVARLAVHFWASKCRPLPIADHELKSIARAHAPTWRHWKTQVLQVFEEIRPELEAYHRLRVTKATTIRFVSAKGGGARSAQAAKRKIDDYVTASAPQITSFHQLGHVPQREPAPPRPQTPDKRPPRPLRTDTLTRR